jgi:hypothetical protein
MSSRANGGLQDIAKPKPTARRPTMTSSLNHTVAKAHQHEMLRSAAERRRRGVPARRRRHLASLLSARSKRTQAQPALRLAPHH